MWRLNNTLLDNQRLKKEIKRKKHCEAKENGNTTNQNLWDAAKVVLRATSQWEMPIHYKTRKTSNNLTLHAKELEKEE